MKVVDLVVTFLIAAVSFALGYSINGMVVSHKLQVEATELMDDARKQLADNAVKMVEAQHTLDINNLAIANAIVQSNEYIAEGWHHIHDGDTLEAKPSTDFMSDEYLAKLARNAIQQAGLDPKQPPAPEADGIDSKRAQHEWLKAIAGVKPVLHAQPFDWHYGPDPDKDPPPTGDLPRQGKSKPQIHKL